MKKKTPIKNNISNRHISNTIYCSPIYDKVSFFTQSVSLSSFWSRLKSCLIFQATLATYLIKFYQIVLNDIFCTKYECNINIY